MSWCDSLANQPLANSSLNWRWIDRRPRLKTDTQRRTWKTYLITRSWTKEKGMRPGRKRTRKSNYIYFGKLQWTSWCLRVPNLLKTWKTLILSGRLIRRLPFAQIHISDENRPSASHFQRNKVLNYRTDFQSKKFSILSLCPRRHQSTGQWLLRTRHSTLETWKTSQGQRRGQRCDRSV
jgi:hypothetical protein